MRHMRGSSIRHAVAAVGITAVALAGVTALTASAASVASAAEGTGRDTGAASTTAAADPADQAIADQSVFLAADLPGWTATPHDTLSDDDALTAAKKVPACKGYVAFQTANAATTHAESQDFSTATDQVHSSSYVYPSAAAAARTMQALGPSKTVARCITTLLQDAVFAEYAGEPGVKRVKAVIKPIPQDVSSIPDSDAVGFGGGFQVTYKSAPADGRSLALVAVRAGRVVNTYSADADPSSDDIVSAFQGAVGASLRRTQAALG